MKLDLGTQSFMQNTSNYLQCSNVKNYGVNDVRVLDIRCKSSLHILVLMTTLRY